MTDTAAVVTQDSKAPTRKWVAATGTGGATLLVLWLAGALGLDMPPEVAGFVVLAAAQAAAYVRRNAPVLRDCLPGRAGAHGDRDGDGLADG